MFRPLLGHPQALQELRDGKHQKKINGLVVNNTSHCYKDRQTDERGLQTRRSFYFVKNSQPYVLRAYNFHSNIFT